MLELPPVECASGASVEELKIKRKELLEFVSEYGTADSLPEMDSLRRFIAEEDLAGELEDSGTDIPECRSPLRRLSTDVWYFHPPAPGTLAGMSQVPNVGELADLAGNQEALDAAIRAVEDDQRLLSLSKQALVQAENPEHCAEQELPGSEGRATYDQAAAHLRPVDERLWAEYDRRGCRS